MSAERAYTLRALPHGVGRGVADWFAGESAGLIRAAAVVAGLLLTSLGFATGRVRRVLVDRGHGR